MVSLAGFRITTEHTIREGKLDEFKKKIVEVVKELEKTETRTQEYIAFITEDGSSVQFVQWYEDEAAFLDHLKDGGKVLAVELEGLTDFVRSWIYADSVSDETRAVIHGYGTSDAVVIGPAHTGYRRFAEII